MKKSSTLIKNSLPKTVKAYSQTLTEEQFQNIDQLCVSYGKLRGMFFNQFCGINNLTINFRKKRNNLRAAKTNKKYMECFNVLDKHVTYALFDSISNINAMWSNTANKIRKIVSANPNVNQAEQHFIFFILKIPLLWQSVLRYREIALPKSINKTYLQIKGLLSKEQFKHALSYLRRLTRRYKAYPHKVSIHNRSMTYDENMYRFKNDEFRFTSQISRKVFRVSLTGPWHYSVKGNLQIILDRLKRRIEIHKLIQTHVKSLPKTQVLGIDKGLAALISCSSGNEYGQNFGEIITKQVNKLAKINAKRNQMRAKGLLTSAKRYTNLRKRQKAHLQSVIDHAIYQMIEQEKPLEIVKEDLTFTKERLPKTKNRFQRRSRLLLNSWVKGLLNERLEYICDKFGIVYTDVNPAYTSQYCPYCNRKFGIRYGKHHELTYCKNCGQLNANIAAAINIKNRKNDKEINLYTPYKKVKKILDSRI